MNNPPSAESSQEMIPSAEEVEAVIDQLIGESEITVKRRLIDEKGLYLLEITIPDGDGIAEYEYRRKGQFPEGGAAASVINVAYYDETGFPVSGRSVARLKDGIMVIHE